MGAFATEFCQTLRQELKESATIERKQGAENYLRNQFQFLGVDTTTRRQVFNRFIKAAGLPPYAELEDIIFGLYKQERELQYCAIELAARYKKKWDEDFIKVVEQLIVMHSWWDTVDAISSLLTSVYFKAFPSQIIPVTDTWNKSENIWLQRSSLLFQLKYKKQTDTALLERYILRLSGSKEFFVQKAIGWILREYAKYDPAWVVNFVSIHKLMPLSKREALKHISNQI